MQARFKRNDIVECDKHTRYMIVEKYVNVTSSAISKNGTGLRIIVTEGGYYKESELTLIYGGFSPEGRKLQP